METTKIALFKGIKIRKTLHNNEWWFVIEDVVAALTDSIQPAGYIKDMRRRDPELSKGWGQIATPLPVQTAGGAQKANCANTEGIFRIIQSIPSSRAEPFKRWLAKVGYERVQETPTNGKPIGSGFLVGTLCNHITLVTAKHVVYADQGNGPLLTNLSYRLNDSKGKSVLIADDYATSFLKGGWVRSKEFDIACRLIVRKDTADFAIIRYSAFLPSKQVQAGAPLFIIGFPLGMRSEDYATPIVRRAMVARSDPNNIIVDGFVFPGNSGGPVVYEPSVQLGTGFTTPILQGDWFVGMVVSDVSYIEPAISIQTGRPRVTFEQNSGLCNVIPADLILDVLRTPEFRKIDEIPR